MSTRVQIPSRPPSTLAPPLRSDINSALLTTGAIERIQTVLLHNLQATGWTANVRKFCLELLRSGECATYGEVMERVIQEARVGGDLADGRRDGEANGVDGVDGLDGLDGLGHGVVDGNVNGEGVNGTNGEVKQKRVWVDVRIPEKVINEGVKVVREALEEVVEIIEDAE